MSAWVRQPAKRWLLLGALIVLSAVTDISAAEDLTDRAHAAQAHAEHALATGRAERLRQRSELANALTTSTQALATASQRRRELATEHARLLATLRHAQERAHHNERLANQQRQTLTATFGIDTLDQLDAALQARIQSLTEAGDITLAEAPVVGRHGRTQVTPILQLGAVARYALGVTPEERGFLITQNGTPSRVAGPPLSERDVAALRGLADGLPASVPLDVSGTLTTRQSPTPWTLGGWFADGGVFAWPILLITLTAMGLVIERGISLTVLRAPPSVANDVLKHYDNNTPSAAMAMVATAATPMARVLHAGLAQHEQGREAMEAAMEAALLSEEPRFERAMSLLAACAAVAPLLGLLGTVTGMIGTFDIIAVHGTGNPRLLSGGISEALVTTQMGLLAAVPILLAHATLSRIIDHRQGCLEQAATALLAKAGQDHPA